MAPKKLENGAQHAMKCCRISQKMVPSVVSTRLIAGYLCLCFLSLNFTCVFHSQIPPQQRSQMIIAKISHYLL